MIMAIQSVLSSKPFARLLSKVLTLVIMSMPLAATAHQHGIHDKQSKSELKKSAKAEKEEMTRKEIMHEISYLAKKLLDDSNEDSIVVKSAAVVKPFIGVCSKILALGIELTCITPDSQAEKNGLKTGDIVQSINGISMASEDPNEKRVKHAYWPIVNEMKTGDVLKMNILRAGRSLEIDVTVGSLTHPAYELKVTR